MMIVRGQRRGCQYFEHTARHVGFLADPIRLMAVPFRNGGRAGNDCGGHDVGSGERSSRGADIAIFVRDGQRDEIGAVVVGRKVEARARAGRVALPVLGHAPGISQRVNDARINRRAGQADAYWVEALRRQ